MSFIENLSKSDNERAGERDAGIGTSLLDAHITSKIGPRPVAASEHIAARQYESYLSIDTEELNNELRDAQDRAAEHPQAWLLRVGIAVAAASEFAAVATLLRFRFGMGTWQVVLLSATLTAGSIVAAHLAIRPTKKLIEKIGGIALFVAITLSFALLRADEARAAVGDSLSTRLAAVMLFVLMTTGPAVAIERLVHKLPESVRVWRKVKTLQSALRRDDKRLNLAQKVHDKRADKVEEWDATAARIAAEYRRGYVHGRAKLGLPNNFNDAQGGPEPFAPEVV